MSRNGGSASFGTTTNEEFLEESQMTEKMIRRRLVCQLFRIMGLTMLGVSVVPGRAWACLVGKWTVRCPNGHDEIVDEVTCNYKCRKCGALAFSAGTGLLVCPNGHPNRVATGGRDDKMRWLCSFRCEVDGLECRLDAQPGLPTHCAR
jgi:hypothetical protein